jgi:hypothetical protein
VKIKKCRIMRGKRITYEKVKPEGTEKAESIILSVYIDFAICYILI